MTKLVAVGLTLAALLLSNGRSASAQSTPGPAGTGHWEGALSVQGKELRIEIELVARSADKWEGSAAFPDMNAKGLMLSAVAVQGQAVTFAIKGVPGDPTFKGTLSKDSKTLSGDFTQGPLVGTFTLAWKGEAKFEAPPKNAPLTKDFEGTWEGTVELNGNKLRLGLKLANQDGGATGTLVAIDQGGVEIALSGIVQTDAHLKLTVPTIGGTYEGDLKDDQITGTWTQGGGSTPLNLKRTVK
jgi:hypothetical protein